MALQNMVDAGEMPRMEHSIPAKKLKNSFLILWRGFRPARCYFSYSKIEQHDLTHHCTSVKGESNWKMVFGLRSIAAVSSGESAANGRRSKKLFLAGARVCRVDPRQKGDRGLTSSYCGQPPSSPL
jgi:hypothetical protein